MIACWANQEFMSDKVNLYASGLVRALRSRPSAGAPEEIAHPESVLALVRPGAWEHGPHGSFDSPKRQCWRGSALGRHNPPPGAGGRFWPSIHPVPRSLSTCNPCLTLPPPSMSRSLSVHDPAAPLPSALLVLVPLHPPIPAVPPTDILSRERVKAGRYREHYMPYCFWPGLATHSSRPGVSEGRCSFEYPAPEVAAFGCPSVL